MISIKCPIIQGNCRINVDLFGQKDYGLGGKALDMAAALGDAYNQYQPPETALGMMALPAKAVYGLGNMIVQDVGDKTKSIMGTDINNPAAMNQAATDAVWFGG